MRIAEPESNASITPRATATSFANQWSRHPGSIIPPRCLLASLQRYTGVDQITRREYGGWITKVAPHRRPPQASVSCAGQLIQKVIGHQPTIRAKETSSNTETQPAWPPQDISTHHRSATCHEKCSGHLGADSDCDEARSSGYDMLNNEAKTKYSLLRRTSLCQTIRCPYILSGGQRESMDPYEQQ